ncbi:MAG: sensor histidine kinase [Microbacterium sp.]|uniref:sensor histidine kinase n=1 Tax=Microbacterium sp. TaxID=51671 RepID=UPI0039E48EC6
MPEADESAFARRRRPSARARLIAPVVISALVQVPASVWYTANPARLATPIAVLHLALSVLGPLALLAGRRWPGPVVALVSAFALTDVLAVPVAGPPYVALGFAIIAAVARGATAWAAVSVGIGWSTAILVASLGGREWRPPVVVAATLGLVACFGVGGFIRGRRARALASREAAMRHRVSAEERERVRIARELHDVLGHALSQISVQAGVGLHLFDRDPEQARAALANVREASKLALDEVRGVLGVLRDGEAPLAPSSGLDELPQLVERTAGPGLRAVLTDRLDGARPSQATQLAVYRIVQEALTNTLRHARATWVTVTLDRVEGARPALIVTIEDDGVGFGRTGPEDADRRGIRGMRERAALLGGTVETGDAAAGGARIVAVLPWGSTA